MMTDIGLTGGGKGNHLVYMSGSADHKVSSGDIVEHIVELVEARAETLKAETHEHADAAQ
jgi:(E)-4-hydroxy-3-methylbut-2-enyl-diphosphate synthase